ncbi:MAG TPA: hypothetical protein VLI90_05675 [Tepidisphaeraceae bacterium]|nr:hypothetical protein [Tepidisphaeraceae bacterium]
MLRKTNRITKTTKTNTSAAQPMFERLEDRRLQSATPINYDGQYVNYTNNVRYEVDFKHSTSATKYTGDVKSGKQDLKLTATETNNKLAGSINVNGKSSNFTAVLNGRQLTLTMGSTKVIYTKRVQTLTPHTASSLFEYDTPSGWTARANTGGLLIKSADGTQQVSVVSGVSSGWIAPQALVNNAAQHGTHVKLTSSSPVYNLGGGLYLADEVAEVTFNVGKTNFTSDVIIASVYNASYAITKVGMASITAPTSVFAKNGGVLVDILSSVHQINTGTGAAAASPAAEVAGGMVASPAVAAGNIWSSFDYGYTFTNGFYDPGVVGNWAYGYTTAWVSPFVAAEQVYMAQTSSAFDAEVAAWHEQFNAT